MGWGEEDGGEVGAGRGKEVMLCVHFSFAGRLEIGQIPRFTDAFRVGGLIFGQRCAQYV